MRRSGWGSWSALAPAQDEAGVERRDASPPKRGSIPAAAGMAEVRRMTPRAASDAPNDVLCTVFASFLNQ
jgi:hypothetical protein